MLLLNNIKAFKLTKKEKNLFVEVESYLKDEIVDTFMRDAELTYQNSKKFDEMFKDFPKRHHPYFEHIKNEVLGWQNKAQEYIDSAKEKKLLADKNELYEKKIGRQKKYFISSVVGVLVIVLGGVLFFKKDKKQVAVAEITQKEESAKKQAEAQKMMDAQKTAEAQKEADLAKAAKAKEAAKKNKAKKKHKKKHTAQPAPRPQSKPAAERPPVYRPGRGDAPERNDSKKIFNK